MKFVLSLAIVALAVTVRAQGPCICTAQYDPVCGTNGRTYSNSCNLRCENPNIRVAYRGECNRGGNGGTRPGQGQAQPCFCPANYDPVCGSDGRTYSNSCQIGCRPNIRESHRGPCRGGRVPNSRPRF